jgi:hypothetical protein
MRIPVQLRMALFVALVGLAVSWTPASAEDAPTRERWFLGMKHGPLSTVVVRDASGNSTAYHYMKLQVTNGTPFPRQWHPLVKAITDTKKTYIAGGSTVALDAIRKAESDAGLVPIGTTAGKLKPGASVNGVAIFGALDALYDRINVQVYGLVDPTAIYKVEQYGDKSPDNAKAPDVVLGADSVIVDSVYWDRNQAILKRLKEAAAAAGGSVPAPHVEYQEVAEQRYWSMDYERLGDEFYAEDDIIRFVREGWRVAGEPTGLRVISTEG